MMFRRCILFVAMLALSVGAVDARANSEPFAQWVNELHAEAVAKGIPEPVVSEALGSIEYDDAIIVLDQKQPEDKATFTQYMHGALNKKRIARGRALLAENHALLSKIGSYYHVQPQYIVALWGMETDYGIHQGEHSVVQSLATLAYDGRRADFFRGELLKALQILATYHIDSSALTGSWAGAMGNCQFMPSSYLNFAVDWDKNGKPDIWNSDADTFASIANYLHQSGWDDTVGWGARADVDADGELVTPGTEDEGMFAVTNNYHVILKWNRSRMFAVSVGMLADELVR